VSDKQITNVARIVDRTGCHWPLSVSKVDDFYFRIFISSGKAYATSY